MRFDRKSFGVILLCVSGAATGGYLLYRDMTETGISGQGAPLAQVLNAEKRVKRKLASSYVWNTLRADQALFRRESVQTGSESSALIRLADGATVEVRENSLVVIDETKNLISNFMRGSLILHQDSGDSVLTAGNDGKVVVQELPVRLVSPTLSQIFFTTKGSPQKIRFEWRARDGSPPAQASSIAVQISRDASFRNQQTLSAPTLDLPSGRYYWRTVQTKDGNKEEAISAIGQFSVVEATPLTLTSPSEGERVEFFGDRATIEFRWVDQPMNSGRQRTASILENIEHELEVSEDPLFKKILATKRIAAVSQSARISGIPTGSVYWRIRSKWGPVTVSSPSQSFRLEQAVRVPIELLAPRDRATLPEAPIRLSWRSDLQKTEGGFSVEVESTAPGKSFTKAESTQAAGISVSGLPPGSYRWRVKSTSRNQVTGESEWKEFSIARGGALTLTSPPINQRIWYWKDPVQFAFLWEPDLLVTSGGSTNSYQLELSVEAEFRNVVTRKQSKTNTINSSEIALKPGSYYWRLQVVDELGNVQKTSTPSRFTYGTYPLLGAPATASPESGTKLNPLELETDPQLSWSKVEGAVTYEVVVVRQTKDAKKLWLRQITPNTSISLERVPEGVYFWSVRALDQIDRLGEPLSDRKLILDAGEPIAAPKTLSREVQ